jgi:SAM-dependent methyltransferase
MSEQIIGLQDWFQTAPGQYLLDWERQQVDAAVADMFGYHALQLGVPQLDGLRDNRMPHRWLTTQTVGEVSPSTHTPVSFHTHFSALPFPAQSLDLVLLPHALELSEDPHATLREVERTLVPEGKVIICGFSPVSLWGWRQTRGHLYGRLGWDSLFLPAAGEFIGPRRLRDWLNLLGFEVEVVRFGCYRPAVSSERWLQRFEWMDPVGARWWPVLGSAYFLVAVKKVRGVRLMGAAWKTVPVGARKPVVAVQRVENKAEES